MWKLTINSILTTNNQNKSKLQRNCFGCERSFIAVHGSLIYGIHWIHMDVLEILEKVLDEVFPQKKVLCSIRFLLQMAYLRKQKLEKLTL